MTDALGNITCYTRDGELNLTSVTDALGNTTTYAYDDKGNMTQRRYALGNTVAYRYHPRFNKVESITDAKGNMTRFGYDEVGNLSSIIDALENETHMAYEEHGLMQSFTDPLGNAISFEYDSKFNLTAIIDPLGNRTEMTYDELNRMVSVTDAEGNTTVYTYDGFSDNIISVTDAAGNITRYEYKDASGCDTCPGSNESLLTKVTDANNHSTTFEYDSRGRLVATTDPMGHSETFRYGDAGKLVAYTDRNGNTINYKYDALDRPTRKISPDDSVEYTYDSVGNLTSVTDSDSQVNMNYDALRRVTNVEVILPGGFSTTLNYDYDKNGNRTYISEPNFGEMTYDYDELNRLASMLTPQGQTIAFGYDELSRRRQMQFPNGTQTEYTYDAASQLTGLVHKKATDAIASFLYTYDKVGNRKTMTDLDGTHSYDYDALYQLIGATHPQDFNPTEHFSYDSVGNRLTSHLSSFYSYDDGNRLLEDEHYSYDYDNNGNLIERVAKADGAVTHYTYNTDNRLVRIDFPDGKIVTYRYDPLGRRIEKNVDGVIARYVYDNEDILLELDETGTILARNIHGQGIDEPLMTDRDGQGYFYHTDGLGSITEMTDSTGGIIQAYAYDVFGSIVQQAGTLKSPYAYTGREFNPESGLYYYRVRYYDSNIGNGVGDVTVYKNIGTDAEPLFDGGTVVVSVGNFAIPWVVDWNNDHTMRLDGVPLETALEMITAASGSAYKQVDSIYIVGDATVKPGVENPLLERKVIWLKHIEATELVNSLPADIPRNTCSRPISTPATDMVMDCLWNHIRRNVARRQAQRRVRQPNCLKVERKDIVPQNHGLSGHSSVELRISRSFYLDFSHECLRTSRHSNNRGVRPQR